MLHSLEHPHWRGQLRLSFAHRFGRTVLERREHSGPLLVQRPLYPEGAAVCHVILLHPPGGLVQGDELSVEVTLHPGSRAVLTTPGAAKWYRSTGAPAASALEFHLQGDATLEWLPRENIVFDGARVRSRLRVGLSGQARFMGWEILSLGRRASGERFACGQLDLLSRIERDGRPIWLEVASLDPVCGFLESPAGLAGYPVFGTFVIANAAISDPLLRLCRELAAPLGDCRTGITRMPALCVARYVGHSAEDAFGWFASLWGALRPELLGLAPMPPRIWAC